MRRATTVLLVFAGASCWSPIGRSGFARLARPLTATVSERAVSVDPEKKLDTKDIDTFPREATSFGHAVSLHPLVDPVLTGVGYHPVGKVPLRRVEPGEDSAESSFAVLATGSAESWEALRDSFMFEHGPFADFDPTEPHLLLARFARADDLYDAEYRYNDELYAELSLMRDALERTGNRVVACVLFAELDPDELERLEDDLFAEECESEFFIARYADPHRVFLFHRSELAEEAEIARLEADIAAAEADLAATQGEDLHRGGRE